MELEKMQAVLYTLADKFLNETELSRVKEMIAMTKLGEMLVEDGIKRGIERGLEEGMEKGLQEGLQKGLQKGKESTARNMKAEGITPLIIQKCTGLSLEEIERL